MATTRTKAAVVNNDPTNVSASAPFYVLYRSKSMGYYYWAQLLGKTPAAPAGGYVTPPGFETEEAAIEAVKRHKPGGHHYDYLIVRALSTVEISPVVETTVTEVKL